MNTPKQMTSLATLLEFNKENGVCDFVTKLTGATKLDL